MKTTCPKCGKEINKTIESARSHVRYHHAKLSDKGKIKLRREICEFSDTGGFGGGRTKEENHLTNQCGIK